MAGEKELGPLKDEAAKALVHVAGDVYNDGLKGVVTELGKTLTLAGKTVNVALAPLRGMVWGLTEAEVWISNSVAQKLQQRQSTGEVVTPDPSIAGPLIMALTMAGHHAELREMYANLLATAMDAKTAHLAHPAFVETMKQLNTDEAKLIPILADEYNLPVLRIHAIRPHDGSYRVMVPLWSNLGGEAGCSRPDLTSVYLENLARLSLIRLVFDAHLQEHRYTEMMQDSDFLSRLRKSAVLPDMMPAVIKGIITMTDYGMAFSNASLDPPDPHIVIEQPTDLNVADRWATMKRWVSHYTQYMGVALGKAGTTRAGTVHAGTGTFTFQADETTKWVSVLRGAEAIHRWMMTEAGWLGPEGPESDQAVFDAMGTFADAFIRSAKEDTGP